MEDLEPLFNKLEKLSKYAWRETHLDKAKIDSWLNNFCGKVEGVSIEKEYALYLLSNFMYFSQNEVRVLLKSLYEDIYKYPHIKVIRENNSNTMDATFINKKYKKVLKKTRFLGVGNPSESGSLLLYYFRQINKLPTNYFINSFEIFDNKSLQKLRFDRGSIDRYVFIDDLCGSGGTACKNSEAIVSNIKKIDPNISCEYYSLFSTVDGLKKINDEGEFDKIDCVFELDESFKVFSNNSRVYTDDLEQDVDIAKKIFETYGENLWAKWPLGHGDCELILGFFYNTPNNTLPVIWHVSEGRFPWLPIFERFGKQIFR